MKGLVVSSSYGSYVVSSENVLYKVTPRGIFRNLKKKVVVGDEVEIDTEELIITDIYPRNNYLIRPNVANIDEVFIVSSLVEPEFSYPLIFKYLTYLNLNNISASLILTKNDLFCDEGKIKEIKDVFFKSHIKTYIISTINKEGFDELISEIKGKTIVLMGQSGVGKSSLINALDPHFSRSVGSYSVALGRGKHETKEVVLLPFLDGYIADTPGFSSLDLNISKADLAKFFPSFIDYAHQCYFSNCLHINEKGCQVKNGLEKGLISPIVYENYLYILKNFEDK